MDVHLSVVWCRAAEEATAEAAVEKAAKETVGMRVATEEGVEEATEAEAVVAAAGGRVAGKPRIPVQLKAAVSITHTVYLSGRTTYLSMRRRHYW